MQPHDFSKVDLKPNRSHGFAAFLFILGTLFPPLAVAARFGIGSDFFLNLLLTVCGYIPGHVHNFYIQNIRNNKNHRRTPKWAQRYGLVNTDEIKRKQKKSQWASRYNDRLPRSTLEDQPYEEGEIPGGSSTNVSEGNGNGARQANDGGALWNQNEEHYYGQRNGDASSTRSSGRWQYPANFDNTVPSQSTKKKVKKDRWARTEDAYTLSGEQHTKKRKKKKVNRSTVGNADGDSYSRRSESTAEFPEDPEGGLYGERRQPSAQDATSNGNGRTDDNELFDHQF